MADNSTGLARLSETELTTAISPTTETQDDLSFYQLAAEQILGSYPNSGIPDEALYIQNLREILLGLGRDFTADLSNIHTGIVTACKWPPSPADIHEFIRPRKDALAASALRVARDRETDRFMAAGDTHNKPTAQEREDGANRLIALSKQMRGSAEKPQKVGLDPRAHCKSHAGIREHMGILESVVDG